MLSFKVSSSVSFKSQCAVAKSSFSQAKQIHIVNETHVFLLVDNREWVLFNIASCAPVSSFVNVTLPYPNMTWSSSSVFMSQTITMLAVNDTFLCLVNYPDGSVIASFSLASLGMRSIAFSRLEYVKGKFVVGVMSYSQGLVKFLELDLSTRSVVPFFESRQSGLREGVIDRFNGIAYVSASYNYYYAFEFATNSRVAKTANYTNLYAPVFRLKQE